MEEQERRQDELIEIPAEVNGEKISANVRLEDLEKTFHDARFEESVQRRAELLEDPDLGEYLKLHDVQVLSFACDLLYNIGDYLNLHLFSKDEESFGETTIKEIFGKYNALLDEFQKIFGSESLREFFLETRDIFRKGKKKS